MRQLHVLGGVQSFDAHSGECQSSGGCNCDEQIFERHPNALTLPGGEGWGEGERKHISTSFDSRALR